MKIHITVEVDGKDAEFFAALVDGGYENITSAELSFSGIGDAPPPVDATWLLLAEVSLEK